jgi:hypothetical protein
VLNFLITGTFIVLYEEGVLQPFIEGFTRFFVG